MEKKSEVEKNNTKDVNKSSEKMTKKKKIKEFIEKSKKNKKVTYNELAKFIEEESISPDEVTKIYDELEKAKIEILVEENPSSIKTDNNIEKIADNKNADGTQDMDDVDIDDLDDKAKIDAAASLAELEIEPNL